MLALNFAVPSLLNFYWRSPEPIRWERFLRYIINLHAETVGPFTRRPVTTALLHQAYLCLRDAWASFLLVQGLLLAAGALALHRVAAREHGLAAAYRSQLIYFASFTVLFSFVTPNDAFDEPAQYLFLFLSLYFLRAGLSLGFGAAFFLACLSRETSVLLLPGFWLLEPAPSNSLRRLPKYLIPLVAWFTFYLWKDAAGDPGRFLYWAKNFASPKIAFETLLSFWLALGLTVAVYFGGRPGPEAKPWTRAFLLTLGANTPIVLFAAYARESRLLALPLVFLWPGVGAALRPAFERVRQSTPVEQFIVLALSGVIWFSYHPVYRHVLGYRLYGALLPILALPLLTRHFGKTGSK